MSVRSRQYVPSLLHKVESIESYTLGGLHPVHLNDILKERHEVIYKLGCGGLLQYGWRGIELHLDMSLIR
jgi:hypothetical protein